MSLICVLPYVQVDHCVEPDEDREGHDSKDEEPPDEEVVDPVGPVLEHVRGPVPGRVLKDLGDAEDEGERRNDGHVSPDSAVAVGPAANIRCRGGCWVTTGMTKY